MLGYLAEVEPLMEPTGGYPLIVRRQPAPVTSPVPAPAGPPATPPPAAPGGPPATGGRRRLVWLFVALLVLIVVVLAGLLLAVQRRQPTGTISLPPPHGVAQTSAPGPLATSAAPAAGEAATGTDAGPTGPSADAQASASPSANAPASAAAQPPPPLTARYETVGNTGALGLTGYRGRVTVSNPGELSVGGWTVTIVLPHGQHVAAADGADYRQDADTVTFTPAAGSVTVPGAGSVAFTFDVDALLGGPPTGCSIDEHACG